MFKTIQSFLEASVVRCEQGGPEPRSRPPSPVPSAVLTLDLHSWRFTKKLEIPDSFTGIIYSCFYSLRTDNSESHAP